MDKIKLLWGKAADTAKKLWKNEMVRKIIYIFAFLLLLLGLYRIMYAFDFVDKKKMFTRYPAVAFSVYAILLWAANIKKERSRLSEFLILLFHTVMAYFLMESLTYTVNNGRIWSLQYLFNLFIIMSTYLLLWGISGKIRVSVVIGDLLFMVSCLGNRMLIDLRGRPLFLSDIFSVTAALNVSNQYNIEYFKYTVLGLTFVLMSVMTFVLLHKKKGKKLKVYKRVLLLIPAVFTVLVIAKTDIFNQLGIQLSYWRHNNGIILDWAIEAKDFRIKVPEGYFADSVEKDVVINETEKAKGEFKKPNVIAIMSESYADLREIGDFETTVPYMSYFDYLAGRDEASPYFMMGRLYSSVYGGNTANSEYEFLTGDSTMIYPQNSIPYQTFFDGKTNINSLVRQFESLGYTTCAMHPYIATGWNRPNIYSAMGFDEAVFIEDLEQTHELEMIRDLCSDKSDFDWIIEKFENKEKGKPMFLFNVTMQNHGGYLEEDFTNDVQIVGKEGMYPKAEQFMSLMKLTDAELQRLVEYFKNYDEPTVIVFFGDHHPKIETEFYEDILGKSFSDFTLEEMQKLYATRYLIWSNEKLNDTAIGDTSINYLALNMAKAINMPMTKYQLYLTELQKYYPVITANIKVDANGEMTPIDGKGADELEMYRFMIYNHVIDETGYKQSFFEDLPE